MVRRLLLSFEFALIAALHIFWLLSTLVGFFPVSAQPTPPIETAHPVEAALNDPNIVQDFMVALPPSDPIPRQYEYYSQWTGRTETAERPEQEAYYQLRKLVTAHRFLTNKTRGRREMKAILLRSSEGFAQECVAKGGYAEPKDSNFYALTQANIRPRTSLRQLEICMRSDFQSLGALLIETNKNSYDYGDEDSHSIITFHPVVVVTQAALDAQAEREVTDKLRREAAWEQERAEVDRWRTTIKPGTETGCGPVLRVSGDLIEVAHYQTREPKWYRRTELSPTLYNLAGLRTCN
jgi:hypothetical protein